MITLTLGKRLRDERKRLGLSQTEIAGKCGVTLRTQGSFERGTHLPGSAYLMAAATVGVDIHYVLTGLPGTQNKQESQLLKAFRIAPKGMQMAAMAVLKTTGKPATDMTIVDASEIAMIKEFRDRLRKEAPGIASKPEDLTNASSQPHITFSGNNDGQVIQGNQSARDVTLNFGEREHSAKKRCK